MERVECSSFNFQLTFLYGLQGFFNIFQVVCLEASACFVKPTVWISHNFIDLLVPKE